MNKLFVYGSLMNPYIQQSIIGREILFARLGKLQDYCAEGLIRTGWISYVARPYKGCSLHGAILELTNDELKRADEWRSHAFKRELLKLVGGEEVFVYLEK